MNHQKMRVTALVRVLLDILMIVELSQTARAEVSEDVLGEDPVPDAPEIARNLKSQSTHRFQSRRYGLR